MSQAYFDANPFPKAVQSDGWKSFVAVTLYALGAVYGGYYIRLDALERGMNDRAGVARTVARASATRGAYALSQAGHLMDLPKGRYMLNDSGVRYAERLLGIAGVVPVAAVESVPVVETVPVVESVPVEAVPMIAAKAMAAGGVGVVWLPPSLEDGDDLFAEDEYLRELAAAATPCFGSYSSRAETCGDCPLRGVCAESLVNRLTAVAKTLDANKAAASVKVAESATVSEILNPPAPAPVAPVTPAPVAPVTPTSGLQFREITAAFQGICSGCKGLIPPGSKARHVAGTGMFHPQCLV